VTTSKDLVEDVPDGTMLFQQAGGGGGYGDPFLRSAEKVRDEIRNGIISMEKAKKDYGVFVNPDTFEIDYDMTDKQRRRA
jgi:N-methylhydantoinase B